MTSKLVSRRGLLVGAGAAGLVLPTAACAQWWPWWNAANAAPAPPFTCPNYGSATALTLLAGATTASGATNVTPNGSLIVGFSADNRNNPLFVFPVTWAASGGGYGAPTQLPLTLGDTTGFANDVSNDGTIVVGYGESPGGNHPIKWVSGVANLLPLYLASTTQIVYACSGDGSKIVGSAGAGPVPVIWESGTVSALPLLGGDTNGEALAISEDGTTIVGYSNFGGPKAVKWTGGPAWTVTALALLPGGGGNDIARDVNKDGTIFAGEARDTNGFQNAVKWTSGGTIITSLAVKAQGFSISADGNVVGGNDFSGTFGGVNAPVQFCGGNETALTAPGVIGNSNVLAISDDLSTIVGYFETAGPVQLPYFWKKA